ncbi:MAG: ATP-binding protein [Acidobacteria bacterium]|nr:ATP-binding protein [Acidobacteriota bacterium]
MSNSQLHEQLAQHRTLGTAPPEELAWLAGHGVVRQLSPGDVLSSPGAPVESMFVILSGHLAMSADQGAGMTTLMEWRGGDVSGVLPYSRLVSPPAASVAQEPTVILAIHRDHLTEMIRECHEVTALLVRTLVDRARNFTSSGMHNEKMISLGKLSAGLAHELNNPASAIERSAALLEDRLNDAERAARVLGTARLSDVQLAAVDAIRTACLAQNIPGVRSPLEQAEREDAISDWLGDHGLDAGLADLLAETPATLDALDRLAAAVQGPALEAVLSWAASGCAVRGLATEIQEAALRISGLVVAIKGFTHMDQANVAQPVDVRLSLANTVAVLKSKARGKSVAVTVEIEPGLPHVRGFGGELNQIWANLIDNALDAVPQSGLVEVRAHQEGEHKVVIQVIDNGGGIPESIQKRIFDPFFTTKPMGEGTGLGLDIVRRLVRHNHGDICVNSKPGRTEFRVALPIERPIHDGGKN